MNHKKEYKIYGLLGKRPDLIIIDDIEDKIMTEEEKEKLLQWYNKVYPFKNKEGGEDGKN